MKDIRKLTGIWALLLVLFFSGCGKQEAESQNEMSAYGFVSCDVGHIVGAINDVLKVDNRIYAAVNDKGLEVSEGRYRVLIYDMEKGSLSPIILQGREGMGLLRFTVLKNGNYKALFVVWDAETTGCTSISLQTFDSQGNLLEEQDVTKTVNDSVDDIIALEGYLLDREGNLLFYTTTYADIKVTSKIYSLNPEGDVKLCKEFEGKILAYENISSEVWVVTANTSDEVHFYNMSSSESDCEKMDYTWNLPAESFDIVNGLTDDRKFIVQQNKVFQYDFSSGNAEQLFAYEDLGLQGWKANIDNLIATKPDEFYVLRKIGETEEGKRISEWIKITKSAVTSTKERLTIAVAEENSYLKDAVFAFNQSSDTYKVEIEVYEKDASNGLSSRLQGDIAAGRIPDMISTDLMELDLLVNKGIAHDLTDLLEADAELSKEAFVTRSLELYQRGDKLYAIPYNIGILALAGKEAILQGRESWTFQEFEDYVKTLPNPQAATGGISQSNMLQAMLELNTFRFVDWEQGTCSFESAEFVKLLQFVSKYPAKSPTMETDIGKLIEALQEDEIILYFNAMVSMDSNQLLSRIWGEKIQWIGFPTEQGSGVQLVDMDTPLVITENSSHKEEMWEILKHMITDPKLAESGIPTYKPLFEKACELASEKNMIETEDGSLREQPKMEMEIEGIKIESYALTNEEITEIKKLLEIAEPVKASSQVIKNIIQEEASAYFNGQKSAEAVSGIIQNRVSLYLNES